MKNNKKPKFYDQFEIRGTDSNKTSINMSVDVESDLIKPSNSDSCLKNSYEYENLDQSNYNTLLKASNLNIRQQFSNYHGHHIGPGKGFGNLNISNDIRYGSSTRLENNEAKLKLEENINSRYDLIDKDFQNPNNLILPFSRGGENTRKSSKNNTINTTQDSEIYNDINPINQNEDNFSNAQFESSGSNKKSKYQFNY